MADRRRERSGHVSGATAIPRKDFRPMAPMSVVHDFNSAAHRASGTRRATRSRRCSRFWSRRRSPRADLPRGGRARRPRSSMPAGLTPRPARSAAAASRNTRRPRGKEIRTAGWAAVLPRRHARFSRRACRLCRQSRCREWRHERRKLAAASALVAATLAGRLAAARSNDDVSTPLTNAGSSCHCPIVWTHADPAPKPLRSCPATTGDRCWIRC